MTEYNQFDARNYYSMGGMGKYVRVLQDANKNSPNGINPIAPLLAARLDTSTQSVAQAGKYMDPFRSRNLKAPQLQTNYSTLTSGFGGSTDLQTRVIYYDNPNPNARFSDISDGESYENNFGWDPYAYGLPPSNATPAEKRQYPVYYGTTYAVNDSETPTVNSGNPDSYSSLYEYNGVPLPAVKYSTYMFGA